MITETPAAPSLALIPQYRAVRDQSERLCAPLQTEDFVIQSMPDASPAKWHLAHTTWFFETFLLQRELPGYAAFRPEFTFLFNSYYNAVGERHPRPQRGVLSRPSVDEIRDYRRHVDQGMLELLERGIGAEAASVVELGLHHEQQHQELLLTDLKHGLSCNALYPVYRDGVTAKADGRVELRWRSWEAGVYQIGHSAESFAYDNEQPRHKVYIHDFSLASRLTTVREYREFIDDGGYTRSELWLSDGWDMVRNAGWQRPLYWIERDGELQQFTLSGLRPLEPEEPVCHISYFEADAFARWAGARLPTEAEWEVAAAEQPIAGNFVETEALHPIPAESDHAGMQQMFGDVWEWTASPYVGYPGYRPPPGALGEYNGKFMCNQFVLRGGSCATPQSHIRTTYRNFFQPEKRWQFSGLRLARDGLAG